MKIATSVRCAAAVLLCVLSPAAPSITAQTAAPERVVAIADIHGAFDEFTEILTAAGLVDAQRRWAGGKAVFVQTGDVFDRGVGVRPTLDLLMQLEMQAQAAGGRVEPLLGNHEIMNLLHEFRDASPAVWATFADERSEERRRKAYEDEVAAAKRAGTVPPAENVWMDAHPAGFVEYVDAIGPDGRYGRWLRSHKAAVVVGDTLFMHAGISPDSQGTISDVNASVAREVKAWDDAIAQMVRNRLITRYATFKETVMAAVAELERIAAALKEEKPPGDHVTREFVDALQRVTQVGASPLLASAGPMWFRGLANGTPESEAQVTALLDRLGVKRVVIGHTPKLPGKIAPQFGGRVFAIDTGMLTAYFKTGQPSALEIKGPEVTAIYRTERQALTPVPAGAAK